MGKTELDKLKEQGSSGTHALLKDLSLISLVPKWPGADNSNTLEEILPSIDRAALIWKWQDVFCLNIAVYDKTLYNTCLELQTKEASWPDIKYVFWGRFRDSQSNQYNFTRLQTARQAKNEGFFEVADRCKWLAQKVIIKVNDPRAQQIHRQNADRLFLAIFVASLSGVLGR